LIKVAWDPIYVHPLPENHRFPMEKYELLPLQLKHEGTLNDANFFKPNPISKENLLAVHTSQYWEDLVNLKLDRRAQLKTGFPHSKELIERELFITGGSLEASLFALKYGIAFNIAGGTHHAFADHGEGFCLLNDVAISATYLLNQQLSKQILVVDLDVHQGNGTAKIFENEKRVFTFSMHGEHNYPLRKEKSDLDIPLPDKINGQDYLQLLQENLPELIKKVNPDFIFYLSGVDILASDQLGRLKVSIEDCAKRDEIVLQLAKENEIPAMISMGGGYSKEINYIVEAHANTYRIASKLWED
tara:strand:- start:28470 stop:29375 length:906 start_codon:yes stop_codon:yes gene_type:complete